MMAGTLKDAMADDAANTLLNEGEFSEWVTYYPAGGGASRQVLANIHRSREVAEEVAFEIETERIEIYCLKDATSDKGGISLAARDANHADTIALTGDSQSERFAYTGRVVRESAHDWTLEYIRPRPTRIGTAQRGR